MFLMSHHSSQYQALSHTHLHQLGGTQAMFTVSHQLVCHVNCIPLWWVPLQCQQTTSLGGQVVLAACKQCGQRTNPASFNYQQLCTVDWPILLTQARNSALTLNRRPRECQSNLEMYSQTLNIESAARQKHWTILADTGDQRCKEDTAAAHYTIPIKVTSSITRLGYQNTLWESPYYTLLLRDPTLVYLLYKQCPGQTQSDIP